jgi:hypothetical protein
LKPFNCLPEINNNNFKVKIKPGSCDIYFYNLLLKPQWTSLGGDTPPPKGENKESCFVMMGDDKE